MEGCDIRGRLEISAISQTKNEENSRESKSISCGKLIDLIGNSLPEGRGYTLPPFKVAINCLELINREKN